MFAAGVALRKLTDWESCPPSLHLSGPKEDNLCQVGQLKILAKV